MPILALGIVCVFLYLAKNNHNKLALAAIMPDLPITERQVERILTKEMQITDNIRWNKKQNYNTWEAKIDVKHPQRKIALEIRITVNDSDRGKYSINLLLYRYYRIRACCVRGSHVNPHTDTNRWHQETHTHRWTDVCRGMWAYTTKGASTETMEEVFRAFCRQCGITFSGKWQELPKKQSALFEKE